MKRSLAGYLALAVVLAGCTSDSGSQSMTTADSTVEWRPSPDDQWEIQLDGEVALRPGTDVYDIDIDSDEELVAAIHESGAKAVCYLNAGAVEDWRSDAGDFPDEVIGEAMEGWDGERWLDVRRTDLLEPIMRKRIETCAEKGFDAIDPDNMNGYENKTGFALKSQDAVDYFALLAKIAREHGLAIGLKNSAQIVSDVLDTADFAIIEQCQELGECTDYEAFVEAGKAVLDIEYAGTAEQVCAASPPGFTTVFAVLGLDAPVTRC